MKTKLSKLKKAALGTGVAVTAAAMALSPVASASTVLYLGGTCGCNQTPPQSEIDIIGGRVLSNYDTKIGVQYPAGSDFDTSIPVGETNLKAALAQLPIGTQHTIAGFSQGALVINAYKAWLMEQPVESRPDPSTVTFVTMGDPSNPKNGITVRMPLIQDILGVHYGAPVETPYDTISIVKEYDGYADVPSNSWNILSVVNSFMGILYVHPYYDDSASPDLPGTLVDKTTNSLGGTTTQYLVPTAYLPLTKPLRDLGFPKELVDVLDGFLRPVVNLGYDRSGYVPVVHVAPVVPQVEVPEVTVPESQPTDLPEVHTTLVSVPKVSTPDPEPVKVVEPVKDEPKVEKTTTTDGNKFSPGDTVADKVKDSDSAVTEVTGDSVKAEPEVKAEPAPQADSSTTAASDTTSTNDDKSGDSE